MDLLQKITYWDEKRIKIFIQTEAIAHYLVKHGSVHDHGLLQRTGEKWKYAY